ncbi:MAG TPA: PadR family transcriptional regulator [Solirubrobacteraceae bacterium]|jgi:DNA-binding PadR family transcriptional regulator|nr:PadR family transcriptional regulator [Solirubrobacteraceae bacterium]
MSRARVKGLSAGEAVLGLVIEQPDHRFSLERRLEARFGSAQFSYSTAYSAVRRLEKDGYVRATGAERDGQAAIYEATPAGVEHFREWVRSSTSAPVAREELHAKIALCEPRDLPRLIDVVHAEELACIAQLDSIRERMLAEQRAGALRPVAEQEWSTLMDRGVAHGEAAFWGGRIARMGRLRVYLEELRAEAERRALEQHRRGREERRAG